MSAKPIPAILHQSWKSKTELPEYFKLWRSSFFELNPGIEDRFYDDADNRALVAETFPSLLPLYDSLPKEIFRADFVRPIYLFGSGGIYADLDYQCLVDLTKAGLRDRELVLGTMGTDRRMRHAIPNAFMASRPRERFWLGFLAAIEEAWRCNQDKASIEKRPEWVTGPVVLRNAVKLYTRNGAMFDSLLLSFLERHAPKLRPEELGRATISLLPAHRFYPLSWKDQVHKQYLMDLAKRQTPLSTAEARRMFPTSLGVTYWSHSWKSEG